jgi:MFS family permease
LIPTTAMLLVTSPMSGVLVTRVGPRWSMAFGILAVATALVWLSSARPGASYPEAILPPVILWGLGIGIAVAPLTAAVHAAVSDHDLGEASAINDAAAGTGGVIAIAVVPALIGAGATGNLRDALTVGYQPAMMVMAALTALAALIAAEFVTNERPTVFARTATAAASE